MPAKSNAGDFFDDAGGQAQHPIATRGNLQIVRDDDNGRAFCLGGLDQTIEDLQCRVSIEIAGGFVDENTPFVRDYDGQNFPAYVYDQMLCFLRAEYNGKTEFLYLPCEEEAIDKAFARLGAPTPDDVELSWEDICIESEKWTERFKEIAAEEGVYELNRLAAAVNCADMDLEKLWAVAEYAEAENAEQLARLAKNIDCFTFVEGANYFQEIGEYVTQNNEDFTVNPAVARFFDYRAFGEYIGEIYYGKFVDGGFIYNDTDTSLLDILYQDEPMTMGGM